MTSRRILTLVSTLALLGGCAGKPILELQEARESLAMARDFEADIYAPDEYQAAAIALEAAEFSIGQQEAAPAWSRSYSTSVALLAQARIEAAAAQEAASAYKEEIFRRAETGLPAARIRVGTAREALDAARGRMIAREFDALEAELAAAGTELAAAAGDFEAGAYGDAAARLETVQAAAGRIEARARQVAEYVDPGF